MAKGTAWETIRGQVAARPARKPASRKAAPRGGGSRKKGG
jgi:hypothetical protein